ncbi:UNVERIFIED_CONTAM: magnesium transporter [Acetivibrio alkalicellulosi]
MNYEKAKELLLEKKYSLLKNELKNVPPVDIAEFLDSLDEKEALLVFRLLPKEIAADVFSYLSIERQAELSDLVNETELSAIMEDLYFDDKVDLLEEMPANVVKKILKSTSEVERKMINQFLMYPDYSAGSLMTIEFVDLKKEMTVGEAIERVRKTAPDKETIYTCYVMDSQRHLEGTISLKDLVLAKSESKIGDIMQKEPIYVKTHDDQENIADMFKKYDLLAVPVVDNEHRLVGIITVDDIVDVIEEEATEDFYKLGAVEPTDEEYISAGTFKLARKRIVWLTFLMISASLTEFIIDSFDARVAAFGLSAFIPLLMDTGGNAGAQASTVVIRSIVLGEIAFTDLLKVIWKEMRISVVVGTSLAVLNFLRIYFISGRPIEVAFTVSITLLITILVAKMLGGILPILAKKLKLDPAIMASPLITTIVDSVALVIFFLIALSLLTA